MKKISFASLLLILFFTCRLYAGWFITDIDTSHEEPCAPTSLLFDANDKPHIAYSMGANTSAHIKYACFDGNSWSIENIGDGSVWFTELALDSSGCPHIAYRSGETLKYTVKQSTSWITETIDSARLLSIQVDTTGVPCIAYTDGSALKLARCIASSWTITVIDSSITESGVSMVIGRNGDIHISYESSEQLKYAKWDGVLWSTQTIDSSKPYYFDSSIALDTTGYPHIAYCYNGIKYASFDGTSWSKEAIVTDNGGYLSLKLDRSNCPNVSYESGIISKVTYAKRQGMTWSTEIVDNEDNTGRGCCMALDSTGKPRISYYHEGYGYLRYASWVNSVVDRYEIVVPTNVNVGQDFSITINAKNSEDNVITTYSGFVNIQTILASSSGTLAGTGILGITSVNLNNGTANINTQTYTKAERIQLKVTDTNGKTGLSSVIICGARDPAGIDLSANPGSLISGQSSQITAFLKDIYGNYIPNVNMFFNVIKGSGTISISSGTTDVNGKVSFVFRNNVSVLCPEVNTIRATVGNLSADVNISIAVLVYANAGGTVIASEDPGTKLYFSSDTFLYNVKVSIRLKNNLNNDEKDKVDNANSKAVDKIVSNVVRVFSALKLSDDSDYGNFASTISVEIPYPDSDNDGLVDGTNIGVDDIRLIRLNNVTGEWEVVSDDENNSADKFRKTIRADISHFSIYSIGSKYITLPCLALSQSSVNLGDMKPNESKPLTFTIINDGGGLLSGTITSDSNWIRVSQNSFENNDQEISIIVDGNILNQKGGQHSGFININSNGGSATILVTVNITCVLPIPNPIRLSSPLVGEGKGEGIVTFFGDGIVPGQTTIKIYTLSGELIKTVSSPLEGEDKGEGDIYWNGEDEQSKIVSSGIYIYTYESPKEKGVGKFTVISK